MGRATKHSWSHSRSSTLSECPRRAFFEYYSEQEPEDRDVWRLKELTPLSMWAGTVVDFIISKALGELRSEGVMHTGLAEYGSRHFWRGIKRSPEIAEVMRKRPRTKRDRIHTQAVTASARAQDAESVPLSEHSRPPCSSPS